MEVSAPGVYEINFARLTKDLFHPIPPRLVRVRAGEPTDVIVELSWKPQGRIEALREHDAAGAGIVQAAGTRTSPVERGDGAHEDPADTAARDGIVPAQEVYAVRQGQHPLAHGDVGEEAVDEVRGGLGHPPRTGFAEAAADLLSRDPRGVFARAAELRDFHLARARYLLGDFAEFDILRRSLR